MNRRQRRRRALLVRLAFVVPAAALTVTWLVGLALAPVHREVTVRVYRSSPEAMWSVLTDLDGMPGWRTDLDALERLPMGNGLVRWLEISRRGRRGVFERAESVPNTLLVVRQAGRHAGRQWIFRLRASDQGTELRVVEERAIRNPMTRTLVRLFGSDRSRIEGIADDLVNRLAGHRVRLAANQ